MSRFAFAVLFCQFGSATAALASCNPPVSGLTLGQWEKVCRNDIEYAYMLYGGGMTYDAFVVGPYRLYQNPPKPNYKGVMVPLKACAPDGSTVCNPAGFAYTCVSRRGLTGSVKCGT